MGDQISRTGAARVSQGGVYVAAGGMKVVAGGIDSSTRVSVAAGGASIASILDVRNNLAFYFLVLCISDLAHLASRLLFAASSLDVD